MKTLGVFLVAIAAAVVVDASPAFVSRVPNGANVGVVALGHADDVGASESLNSFGEAFAKAGQEWTNELCQADSDGDGQTNGQELGDPCCEWTTGGAPKWTTGVSHPGDATKNSDASLWATVTCSGSSSTTSTPATTSSAANSMVTGAIGATAAVTIAIAHW